MKIITLFLSLFLSLTLSCFAFANLPEDHSETTAVDLYNLSVEDLPPLEEMVGIVLDLENENFERGEEIQLAHGDEDQECRRRHGHGGCGYDDHHHHGDIIVPIPVPVPVPVPVPAAPQSYICRSGGFYCHLPYIAPIGSYCKCYSFGVLLFNGHISSW